MVKIAIAGGTSPTLGHAIVSAILRTPNTPIVLSRAAPKEASSSSTSSGTTFPSPPPPPRTTTTTTTTTTTLYGAEVRQIDYTSATSLTTALADIHTLISVLGTTPGDPDRMATTQINLLNAARVCGVRRFAPSEFGFGLGVDTTTTAAAATDAAKARVWQACLDSGLEVARFRCGLFMNHLALGRRREFEGAGAAAAAAAATAREKALAGLEGPPVLWDFARGVAEVPVKADGGVPRVTLTEIDDVGRFVAAACGLTEGSWVKDMDMVGETLGLGEVVRVVRECLGVELRVMEVGREELERRVEDLDGAGKTRDEAFKKMMAQMELVMLEDREGWGRLKPTLNNICIHTKPLSVREYLTNY